MKSQLLKSFVAIGLIGAILVFAGCSSCKPGKPGPIGKYNVEVVVDESLKNSSVIADIVGVNSSSLPGLENYDMGVYWKDGDLKRHDADKIVLDFVTGSLKKSLPATDKIWEKWRNKGVTHIVVLADLPGSWPSRPGNQDPRRQILSLDQCNWPPKTTDLKILVKGSGIEVETPVRLVQ
jgi:hypothetical protein